MPEPRGTSRREERKASPVPVWDPALSLKTILKKGTSQIADESALVLRSTLEKIRVQHQPVLALSSVHSFHYREKGLAHRGPAISSLLPF